MNGLSPQTLLTSRVGIAAGCAFALGLFFWLRHCRRPDRASPSCQGGVRLLPTIIIAGLVCRLVFALLTPEFQAPDEYPHLRYIQYVAENRRLPVQEHMWGDRSYDWEFCQPPLYYVLMAPLYLGLDAAFHSIKITTYVLRLVSVLIWGANVWLAFVLLKRLNIGDALIKNFTVAFISLLPTYAFISAVINNDTLLSLVGAALLCLMAGREVSVCGSIGLGVVLGLALLTKQSAVLFVPAIVALYCFRALWGGLRWRSALLHLGVVLGCGFCLFLPWALRNYHVYGNLTPEFLFVERKTWWNPLFGMLSAAHTVLKSFWAAAGPGNEVGYPFPLAGYVFLFLCFNWRKEEPQQLESVDSNVETAAPSAPPGPDFLNRAMNRPFWAACTLAILLNLLLVLRFGYVLGMGQGRHLFPVLLPIALLLAARWRTFPVKNLEPYSTGLWLAYALGFLVYSAWLLPRFG